MKDGDGMMVMNLNRRQYLITSSHHQYLITSFSSPLSIAVG
jgi:hypothetical protein